MTFLFWSVTDVLDDIILEPLIRLPKHDDVEKVLMLLSIPNVLY